MLHELRLYRASALLLVVVALFSSLVLVPGRMPYARAEDVLPDSSGLTTISSPEVQLDMGSPVAPDQGGVTMVLPEAQDQEKGGPVPNAATHMRQVSDRDDVKEQNGTSASAHQEPDGSDAPDDSARLFAWRDTDVDNSDETLGLDAVFPVWLNASCGGTLEVLTLWIEGVGDVQTPYSAFWNESTVLTINVTSTIQNLGFCKRCVFDQWSDGDQNTSKSVIVTGVVELLAQFHDEYNVQLDTDPVGLVLEWKGAALVTPILVYERPGSYTAYAITPQGGPLPDERYEFTNWSDESIVNPRIIVVAGPSCTNMTAIYNGLFRVTVTTIPPGLLVSYDGRSFAVGPIEFWANSGSAHMALTTSPQPPNPVDVRYRFDHWIAGPWTWGWNVTVDAPSTYTAVFVAQYKITILSIPPGRVIGTDILDCGMALQTPIVCWADENSYPNIIIISPQIQDRCRYVFLQWSDGNLQLMRPIGPISGAATYVAIYGGECIVTMQMDGSCQGSVTPNSGWYSIGDTIGIAWTGPGGLPPGERYRFRIWIGEGRTPFSSIDPITSILIQDAINITAYCYHEYLVDVDTSPSGLDYQFDDIPVNGHYTYWWLAGSAHWINVSDVIVISSESRLTFGQWSDGLTETHRLLIVMMPRNLLAIYMQQYRIMLTPPGIGNIRCVENPDCWYLEGASATVAVTSPWPTAAAYVRYDFLQWQQDAAGTSATFVFTAVNSPKLAEAIWLPSYKVTVTSPYGSPSCSNPDCWFAANSQALVILQETIVDDGAGTRHIFVRWEGDATGLANPLAFTVDGPLNITAIWKTQHLVTVTSDCGTTSDCGSPSGGGWYDKGLTVEITIDDTHIVDDDVRYIFKSWSGDASGSANPLNITMDGARNVIADWELQYRLSIVSICGETHDCGSPEGAGWYSEGGVATISVRNEVQDQNAVVWLFDGWTGGASGTANSTVVLMDGAKSVTAHWVQTGKSDGQTGILTVLAATLPVAIIAVFLIMALVWLVRRKRKSDEDSTKSTSAEPSVPSESSAESDKKEG